MRNWVGMKYNARVLTKIEKKRTRKCDAKLKVTIIDTNKDKYLSKLCLSSRVLPNGTIMSSIFISTWAGFVVQLRRNCPTSPKRIRKLNQSADLTSPYPTTGHFYIWSIRHTYMVSCWQHIMYLGRVKDFLPRHFGLWVYQEVCKNLLCTCDLLDFEGWRRD